MFKRCLSVILFLVLIISLITILPVSVNAQEEELAEDGADNDLAESGFSIRTSYPGTSNYYYVPESASNPYPVNTHGGNCTWYAWGRVYEASGEYPNLPRGNANIWYNSASCAKGSTPRPGAVICGNYGANGHVAFVEKVYDDGVHFDFTESSWDTRYPNFAYNTYKTSANFSGFQGFLYPFNGSNDKDGPSYDDFHVGEIQSNQFTVIAHVTDPSGIREVRYAIWTENNGQDDIKWYDGHCTDGNDYYWARINFSDHKGEKGKYIIHMYAYDNAGNLTNPGITYDFTSTGPKYSDFHVGEFREGAFTILAKVTDINGVSSVRYAVWTENNGQDDLKWYDGHCTDGNDYYWARVNFSDHKNEKGKYIIHMYAYDTAGKLANPGITFVFPETGPTVSNVNVSNISSAGYTITCNVSADVGVSRVQFPTWTEKDGQDDLASEWWTNTKVKGTINGNTVTFRVNTSEHNREVGKYITHLYAYDLFGTATKVVVPTVEVPAPISNVAVTDIDELGFTITCEVDSAWGPISKVEFPTWTDANGQDDIVWHQSNYSNGKATCRILTKDHNNTISGRYLTHIYVWDNSGHAAAVNQIDYPCLSFDYGKALTNPTEPSPTILGDADGDGVVTILDATAIQKKLASITVPTYIEIAADVDDDKSVTVIDANYIQKHLAHMEIPYEIGKTIA
ncbi:MAG: GBS Bsp-like repeat-containing protein [Ruminococcus sp.]|nr:GBS Bsp-like repeat-containing protein [Ruminococcus sp.]